MPIYSYEDAIKLSTDYFDGDDLAANVFISKYALRNENNEIIEPTPDQMHLRMATEFARIEQKYPNPMSKQEIYELLKEFKYIVPQGSPMSGIGNEYQIQSISNCFVIDSPYDSYSGILTTDQEQAQIMKRRGGVGFDISKIRPRGMATKNSARTTDGIGVFMERFSNTTREVAQNGRRGALMLTISVHHPEIQTFINIKRDRTKVTGANISIRLSDEFMQAVKNDEEVELRWPVDSKNPIISKMVKAKSIWDEIIAAAWESAEPGLLFWDTVLKESPADIYKELGFRTISTNPCGELLLSMYDSCRLIVENLISFVVHPFTDKAYFDYKLFAEITQKAQRLMDDMVDLELEQIDKILNKIQADPEPENVKRIEFELWKNIKSACQNGRRTGLGITALGDTLAALGIIYGSKESIEVTEKIYKELAVNSEKSSAIMAGERGTFPVFDIKLEQGHPYIEKVMSADADLKRLYIENGRRNISNTTTAPVGSVSMLTKTTSGIEPAFLVKYTRRKKINLNDKATEVNFVDHMGDKWQEFTVFHHQFKKWMDITGKSDIKDSPYNKATSNDVDWLASVRIQAAAQKWISHSISKTCNLPNSATKELVSEIYMTAWESGCKGFTVYRDGCRTGVLVDAKPKEEATKSITKTKAPKRPTSLSCDVYNIKMATRESKSGTTEYIATVGILDNNDPYEIFVFEHKPIDKKYSSGKLIKRAKGHYDLTFTDGFAIENIMKNQTEEEELVTRMTSTALRHGADISFVVHQLEKIKSEMSSFTKTMCRVLKKYIVDGTKVHGEKCQQCNGDLIRKEGCASCPGCGWSKC